jgi:hypothetical protein
MRRSSHSEFSSRENFGHDTWFRRATREVYFFLPAASETDVAGIDASSGNHMRPLGRHSQATKMIDGSSPAAQLHSERRESSIYGQNWLYLVMLVLALAGVAATSVARQSMTTYWIALAPVFAALCIYAQWRDSDTPEAKWSVVWGEAAHWLAVMVAMYLVFVGNVRQMMNADASALMILTILALGTFTAGLQARAWRICFVGFALALGVPLIAWIDRATLLLLLLAGLLSAFVALLVWRNARFG